MMSPSACFGKHGSGEGLNSSGIFTKNYLERQSVLEV